MNCSFFYLETLRFPTIASPSPSFNLKKCRNDLQIWIIRPWHKSTFHLTFSHGSIVQFIHQVQNYLKQLKIRIAFPGFGFWMLYFYVEFYPASFLFSSMKNHRKLSWSFQGNFNCSCFMETADFFLRILMHFGWPFVN